VKALRHHANDGLGPAVQLNRLTQKCRIAAESSLPEVIAKNHDRGAWVAVLFVVEGATEQWRSAKNREERRFDVLYHDLFRIAAARQVRARVDHRGHRVERRAALTPADEVRRAERVVPPGRCAPSSQSETMRSGSRNGRRSSSTAFTMVKIAVFAPMPSARASTAVAVNPGVRMHIRIAYRMS